MKCIINSKKRFKMNFKDVPTPTVYQNFEYQFQRFCEKANSIPLQDVREYVRFFKVLKLKTVNY